MNHCIDKSLANQFRLFNPLAFIPAIAGHGKHDRSRSFRPQPAVESYKVLQYILESERPSLPLMFPHVPGECVSACRENVMTLQGIWGV